MIPVIIATAVITVIIVTFVVQSHGDVKKIHALASSIDMKTSQSFFRGLMALSSSYPRTRIWITRWEDPSCDGPALLMEFTFTNALLYPLSIANAQSIILGLPFERPFSRPRGLQEIPQSIIPADSIHVFARDRDRDRVLALLADIDDVLTAFCNISRQREALFYLGRKKLKISVDIGTSLDNLQMLYHSAAACAEAVEKKTVSLHDREVYER